MSEQTYHSVIIGAGSGGLTVAVGLAGLGKKVALVEKLHVGGDCTNVGCVPSKILIHEVKNLHASGLSPDEILAKVQEKRNHLRDEETEWVEGYDKVEFIEGTASFVNNKTVEVSLNSGGNKQLTASNIIIATGASAIRIPVEGLPAERALTNESVFEQKTAPKHMAIIGAGVIGTEMAFSFKKLGSEVTLIDLAPRVMAIMSEKTSDIMDERLKDLGVNVQVGTKATHYDEATNSLHLDNGAVIENVDKVLLAIGRAANVNKIGLDNTDVAYTRRGITTDAYSATNVRGIYAIGDVTPQSNFTHSANAQGRRLVMRLAMPFLPRLNAEPLYPSATFSDPEVAQIGPNLETLQKQYHPELIKSYTIELKTNDKGFTESLEHGFITIHAMRLTGKVLSAEIVAPKASEMISVLTLAIYQNISLYKLSNMIFPYPTLSSSIKKIADNFVFETLPKVHKEALAYARYRLPISLKLGKENVKQRITRALPA